MRNFKKGAALALASAAAIAGSIFTSSPAMAASSPIAACGGGSYHVIDKEYVGKAIIYLLYNGTTNCVVTWKNSPGTTTYVSAQIRKPGGSWKSDGGNYRTYAGPVKVNAAGQCIQWGGSYGSNPNEGWYSPWEHCG
ncbi:spore-associated protein A [Actinomadura rugatobispora]|uniref:Spore-associated protein A n=1 Tax=Actinomadura rugatobispora TaxID=1994 RepID=A0ABW1A9Y9_9ACTN